jgi:cytochrome c-type biogenesis protein CcmF
VNYQGEELLYGQIGNVLVALSFTGALLAAIAFFLSFRREDEGWKKIARSAFAVHSLSVIGIFILLYYLIFNHRFEYYYVWQHSSRSLPAKYIFSCFWEGQEGSFLLWSFWHIVLSWVIIFRRGKWEAPVMMTVALVQAFLASMILGVYIAGIKIGSNPFILLREHPDMARLPFVQFEDYLQRIEDGRGLNPLLQNYWMVIHPPTLFLGFASTVIPFAFALSGLMDSKNITAWIKQALPWVFFSILSLGAGILMGGAWAYEALSFGGFWAWDPVENASLVPWITAVAAAHVMIIFQKKNQALLSSFIFSLITFLLVLYSTFLTRSGILGNSSVHAFTDLGMSGQLVFYMGFFVLLAVVLLLVNRKKLITPASDDKASSREFWMFTGVMFLTASVLHISFVTSLPVVNKIFGSNLAPPENAVQFYNLWQTPIAIAVCLLMAVAQFFKFKQSDVKTVLKNLIWSFAATLILTALLVLTIKITRPAHILLLFATVFSILANADYLIRILKGKLNHSGASVAHAGFSLLLLGALISFGKQEVISKNLLQVDLGPDFPNNENIMLVKHDTLRMGSYYVTWTDVSREGVHLFYNIDYLTYNKTTGKFEKSFSLKPMIQLNERMGNVAEPSTRHFWNKDIYTHITYANIESAKQNTSDSLFTDMIDHALSIGDTLSTSNSLIVLRGINKNPVTNHPLAKNSDLCVSAILDIIDVNRKYYLAEPLFIIRNSIAFSPEFLVDELGLKFSFRKINPEHQKFIVGIAERKSNKADFIIMKAIVFPGINLLWIGCLIMLTGTFIAMVQKFRKTSAN